MEVPPSTTQSPTPKVTSRKRKTEIKKIENKQARNVCFSKRRQGLFKIAHKYHRISKSDVAVLVVSSSGKSYVDGSPSFDPIVQKFLHTQSNFPDSESTTTITGSSVSDCASASNAVIGEGFADSLREWVEFMKVEECGSLEELKVMKKTLEEIKEKLVQGFVDSLVMGGV
ncbi:hypothetical protein L6164_022910 [Bauhinia variegata]|uniref:Uncharacterized protein n=1 Tax=Bauhinia variegata TaxID=167791 RepID=A0ACB9MGM1_BAUVA|nr:hypothetical protein L6164_022910 [Bauhinia variegata]